VKTKPGIAQRLPSGQNIGKQLTQTAPKVTKTPSREEKKKIKTDKDSEPALIPCQYNEKTRIPSELLFIEKLPSVSSVFCFLYVSVFLYMESN
jgi:hypothetical protein